MESARSDEITRALFRLDAALSAGKLTSAADGNIRRWLTEEQYSPHLVELLTLINDESWPVLERVFWTELPFGTAGRRGTMFPVGCNAINDRTIGETVAAAAEYAKSVVKTDGRYRAAVGYDTRHGSRAFAQLTVEILVSMGFQAFVLGSPRSTPQVALAVRHFGCHLGFMITASHNPPTDNAVKVFWSHGGQLRSPHEERVSQQIALVKNIGRLSMDEARSRQLVVDCTKEIDDVYRSTILACSTGGGHRRRSLRILYSPLHGVGEFSTAPVLRAAGFDSLEIYAPHAVQDPDFSGVPDRIANPEHAPVFDKLIAFALEHGHDLIIASDPDADRIGAAVRHPTTDASWQILNGNQLAALLAEFLLRSKAAQNQLTWESFIVKTLVTTPLLEKTGKRYGIRVFGDVLTGFKWLGGVIDEVGPEHLVMAAEEAHGYLVGNYIRDKDAAGAALILAEFADEAKSDGRTLVDELDAIFIREGVHLEQSFAITLEGAQGIAQMNAILDELRMAPPRTLVGNPLTELRDYRAGTMRSADGSVHVFTGPQADLVVALFDDGRLRMAVRPSGTEPKLKFYLFGNDDPCPAAEVRQRIHRLNARVESARNELQRFVQTIQERLAGN
jgi:phosphoglucomutase/phosphomannomutase